MLFLFRAWFGNGIVENFLDEMTVHVMVIDMILSITWIQQRPVLFEALFYL